MTGPDSPAGAGPAGGAGDGTLSLASFNVHCGVDGWGRPFDVVAACATLDADVLVMQESWGPDDGRPSTAAAVADRLGYRVTEAPMAHGRLYGPHPDADRRWGPPRGPTHTCLALDDDHRLRLDRTHRHRPFSAGTFAVAVLTRVPFAEVSLIELGKLHRDPAHRVAITGTVPVGEGTLTVLGTHMSHLLHRSPTQYLRLRRALPPTSRPAVLAGDMNLWGPPVTVFLAGWRRAVIGRTWPAWRPHSQLDHVVATPAVAVGEAWVGPSSGSDHRPVRVVLALAGDDTADDGGGATKDPETPTSPAADR